MTLFEFLKPISPYITIRLFGENGVVYKGVKEEIPIKYLDEKPEFVTVSFQECIMNIDLNKNKPVYLD